VKPTRHDCAFAAILALLGCGDDPSGLTSSAGDPVVGAPCGSVNETRRCTCESGAKGAQSCADDGWTECVCDEQAKPGGGGPGSAKPGASSAGTPAGNLRSDIEFEWERTQKTSGSCEPGYYEGDFEGLYASGLTVVGAPIPVFALGTPGKPGLSFTLERKSGGGEKLEITNGKMDGVADGAFPFKGTLTGSLDCETLVFDSILDGYYSLGVDGIGMFKFVGPLLGKYDKDTHSIVMATWKVKEFDPPPIVDWAGGEGTWEASWKP
jgi:hypothetical protein